MPFNSKVPLDSLPDISTISSSIQKALLSHACTACAGVISPGDTYMENVYMENGNLKTCKVHFEPPCPAFELLLFELLLMDRGD